MESLPYLDIHAHGRKATEGSLNVLNLSSEELKLEHTPGDYATAGIHPWWVEDLSIEEIEKLKNHLENLVREGRLWAIGETGIDRSYPEFLDQQKALFQWHWDLAEKAEIPLIIHNVRSGSDFLEVLKARKPQTPWIFHDFRGNEQLLRSLLTMHSDCYFSFGISLDNSPQVRELIQLVPLENLFLETDSQKHLDIHDIYVRASESLHIDLELLKSQTRMNFKKLTKTLS